jgi:hypothetical protein
LTGRPAGRAYFNTLYTGTTQVIVDLCQEGTYQTGTIPLYSYQTDFFSSLTCLS